MFTCYDQESRTLFAIVASNEFALLYKCQGWIGSRNVEVEHCMVLTIKRAHGVMVINSEQVAVVSALEVIVVNHMTAVPKVDVFDRQDMLVHQIDFKLKFESPVL